jgi:hypothetical protein
MKIKSLIAILLLASTAAAFSQKKNYIGYRHKGVVNGQTLDNGVKSLGGGLTSDENYGVSRFSIGKKYMLWLEEVVSHDARGVPSWQVKDVLTFNSFKKNEELLFSYTSGCTQHGRTNLDLVVKAEFLPKTKTYKVQDAWQVNLKREKFEKISMKGIKCKYITE